MFLSIIIIVISVCHIHYKYVIIITISNGPAEKSLKKLSKAWEKCAILLRWTDNNVLI